MKMGVQEGQLVVAGNVLAVLDLSAYTAQIQSKEIELQMARLEMQKADLEMQKTKNEVKNAEQSYLVAINDLRRKEQLFKEGAIPEAELDIYKTTATEQEKALHNLQLALQSSSTQDRQLLKSKIAKLEVELKQMEGRLQKTYLQGNQIIADVGQGVISDLGYQAGDQLENGNKLFSLLDLSSIIVEADVPEEFIREVKIGAAAAIVPLADPGKVTAIGSKAIEKKGETVIPGELTLDQRDERLLPGL